MLGFFTSTQLKFAIAESTNAIAESTNANSKSTNAIAKSANANAKLTNANSKSTNANSKLILERGKKKFNRIHKLNYPPCQAGPFHSLKGSDLQAFQAKKSGD